MIGLTKLGSHGRICHRAHSAKQVGRVGNQGEFEKLGKGVIAMYKGKTPPRTLPPAIKEHGIKLVAWNHKAISAAIDSAARKRNPSQYELASHIISPCNPESMLRRDRVFASDTYITIPLQFGRALPSHESVQARGRPTHRTGPTLGFALTASTREMLRLKW